MDEKTDQELYYEFLDGKKDSFEEIVIKYKDKLIFFVQKYVKSIDVAEDIVQDVFVYILVHRVKYDFKYSLKTYLYTIAKSKAFNFMKREKKFIYTDSIEQEEMQDLEEKVFESEKAKNLKNAIAKLNIKYQNAIYLADIENLSYKEIGNIMNKNTAQIKVLIHRARKSLEKVVRKEAKKYEK